MTVQELIDELNKIPDKTIPVCILAGNEEESVADWVTVRTADRWHDCLPKGTQYVRIR